MIKNKGQWCLLLWLLETERKKHEWDWERKERERINGELEIPQILSFVLVFKNQSMVELKLRKRELRFVLKFTGGNKLFKKKKAISQNKISR